MRRRLVLQVYAAMLLILVCSVVAAGVVGRALAPSGPDHLGLVRFVAERMVDAVPADAQGAEMDAALAQVASETGLTLQVWSADGVLVGSTGAVPLELAPLSDCDPGGSVHHRFPGPGVCVQVADGRWVAGAMPVHRGPGHLLPLLGGLFTVALVVGAGAMPLARRVTRRVEALRGAVDEWGEGDLGRRVPVDGDDEVADLARSFNRSADRVGELMRAQRRVLADASHELRSPLARLRMALTMLEDAPADARSDLLAEATADVIELDGLIEDVLVASRLRAGAAQLALAECDLTALCSGVAEPLGVTVTGSPAPMRADPRLLRRLVRNLLENGQRHAGGAELRIRGEGGRFRVEVLDRGPGVASDARTRVFEPFYRAPGRPESAGGVGLGLSLVADIARAHGGEFGVVDREGGGSCFWVLLPARPTARDSVGHTSPPAAKDIP